MSPKPPVSGKKGTGPGDASSRPTQPPRDSAARPTEPHVDSIPSTGANPRDPAVPRRTSGSSESGETPQAPAISTSEIPAGSVSESGRAPRTLQHYLITPRAPLPESDAQGFRTLNGRRFVDVRDGIVPVGTDPQTAQLRAKLLSELTPSGPVLVRDSELKLWFAVDAAGPSHFRLAAPRTDSSLAMSAAPPLRVSAAQTIEFDGGHYFIASFPDAGDGQHYLLRIINPDNSSELLSSGIIAGPDKDGIWRRKNVLDEYMSELSDDEFHLASESMPLKPFTPAELESMRREDPYLSRNNQLGTYNRANNGKYPLRDLRGRPVRIRTLETKVTLANGHHYISEPIKPYIKFGGYEDVARLYEEKLELRLFNDKDVQVPGERALVGQFMVVANKRIAEGEIVGVYGGTLRLISYLDADESTFSMLAGFSMTYGEGKFEQEPIVVVGDTIISRINTNFEYDAAGKPIRQAAAGYNVDNISFNCRADLQLGDKLVRRQYSLNAMFATADIPAGTELRLNYRYSENQIARKFP